MPRHPLAAKREPSRGQQSEPSRGQPRRRSNDRPPGHTHDGAHRRGKSWQSLNRPVQFIMRDPVIPDPAARNSGRQAREIQREIQPPAVTQRHRLTCENMTRGRRQPCRDHP
jgi:hypothetical protein